VLEAMCAGVPSIVSEWTGTREAVEHVDPGLVVPCDAESAAEKVHWYFSLSPEARRALSARCREVAAQYSEERAVESFVSSYRQVLGYFGLPDLPQELIGRNPEVDQRRC
jgi:glycosyltransferase involved in cell wall biosynthesis